MSVIREVAPKADHVDLIFDSAKYERQTFTFGDQSISCFAYESIVYVSKPVDREHQILDIYIPAAYFEGGTVGSYHAETAPIFFPNAVGAYLPAKPIKPRVNRKGNPNASLVALTKGYVVVSPGARGRTLMDVHGRYTGKAPACIVDLKAAVRYLRYNRGNMPGDMGKIIANGFSAGGALSALLGVTGNSEDYEPYLKELGAAEAHDDIFAASCYCPVTNLEHADSAYEWQFSGVDMVELKNTKQMLTADQRIIAEELKSLFPAYLNGLGLEVFEPTTVPVGMGRGTALSLDANGNGSFRDYVKSFLVASAQKAMTGSKGIFEYAWLTIDREGCITDINLAQFFQYINRVKAPPAFDTLDVHSPECGLFGSESMDARHFTPYGSTHSTSHGIIADCAVIRLMNPMNYIGVEGNTAARFWRIRQGTLDRGSSLAVPIILAAKLQSAGLDVDCELAWDQPHGGDYDMEELFAWIDRACAAEQ